LDKVVLFENQCDKPFAASTRLLWHKYCFWIPEYQPSKTAIIIKLPASIPGMQLPFFSFVNNKNQFRADAKISP